MTHFKAGQRVVKIIRGPSVATAAIHVIASVKKGRIRLEDSVLDYDAKTGEEIDPSLPGYTSEIVYLESD